MMPRTRKLISTIRLATLVLIVGGCAVESSRTEAVSGKPMPGPMGAAGTSPGPDVGSSPPGSQPVAGTAAPGSPSSDCEPGTYEGTFECQMRAADGASSVAEGLVLSGPIVLTFEPSEQAGEFSLVVSGGEMEASANLFLGMRAKIEGSLDCFSRELQAHAVDGAWAIGDPNAPLLPGGSLEFTLSGILDPTAHTIGGEWSLDDPALTASVGTCNGPWSVTLKR